MGTLTDTQRANILKWVEADELTDTQRANILKWVEALESGNYNQTTGVLRNKYGYCCLGVACATLQIPARYNNIMNIYLYGNCDNQSVLPSEAVSLIGISKAGVFPEPVRMPNGKIYHSLVELNDTSGYDFKTIAKIIRQVWLGEK